MRSRAGVLGPSTPTSVRSSSSEGRRRTSTSICCVSGASVAIGSVGQKGEQGSLRWAAGAQGGDSGAPGCAESAQDQAGRPSRAGSLGKDGAQGQQPARTPVRTSAAERDAQRFRSQRGRRCEGSPRRHRTPPPNCASAAAVPTRRASDPPRRSAAARRWHAYRPGATTRTRADEAARDRASAPHSGRSRRTAAAQVPLSVSQQQAPAEQEAQPW